MDAWYLWGVLYGSDIPRFCWKGPAAPYPWRGKAQPAYSSLYGGSVELARHKP